MFRSGYALEMPGQGTDYSPARRELDRCELALLCDLVNVVGQIHQIELERQPVSLVFEGCQARRKIHREVLRQTHPSVFLGQWVLRSTGVPLP